MNRGWIQVVQGHERLALEELPGLRAHDSDSPLQSRWHEGPSSPSMP